MKGILLFIAAVVGVVGVLFSTGLVDPLDNIVINSTPDCIKQYVRNFLSSDEDNTNILKSDKKKKDRLLTKEMLKRNTGENGRPIYLAVLGQVFDVTKGRKHYGADGGYGFFAGKDGTRAFVSGDFTDKGLREDIDGLSNANILEIENWVSFYSKDYTYVGKLIGHYYDKDGNPTEAYGQYEKQLKVARLEKDEENADYRKFPTCNSESAQGKGRRLWCSNRSGGIQRDWVGVPRQYYKPGSHSPRCACVKDKGPPSTNQKNAKHKNNGDLDNPNMKVYQGCDPKSISCSFPEGQ